MSSSFRSVAHATRGSTRKPIVRRVPCKFCHEGMNKEEAYQIKPKTGRMIYVCSNCVKTWWTPTASPPNGK